jgi:Zn-dependent protease with chaperone function
MNKRVGISPFYFWFLLGLTFTLIGVGLGLMIWTYGQGWGQTLWHVCQSGINNLSQHLPLVWQLAISAILAVVIGRGIWSLGQQIAQTRRFARLFWLFQERLPTRLRKLLRANNLSAEKVVYLDIPTPRAFCLGFWRPRIWLTAGLINLLSDEELTAVLAHEICHCRRRDPLRLLISRAIKSAFFFLPLVTDLAQAAELQQEAAADKSAIRQLGDDLPLLCALQKLLTHNTREMLDGKAILTSFNATEARLRRLISPAKSVSTSFRGWELLAKWSLNLGVVIILGTVGFLSTRPVVEHQGIGTCSIEDVVNSWETPR